MKKYLVVIIAVLTAACFYSCDKIEGPYVTIQDTEDVTADFPELDPSTVYRKIFFEEYTAHRCPNCPRGHERLETLQETYGDTLVAMAIHATTLATPIAEFPADFRTDAGNELTALYNIDGIPAAIINRGMVSGGLGLTMWTPKLKQADRTVYAAIQLVNQYGFPSADNLKVNAKVTMLAGYPNPLRLALYLVEDGIVSRQMYDTEVIEDYVHNHMLRAAINGTFGEIITPDGMMENNASYTYAKSISFAGKDWNPDHCSVIAILYDKNDNAVLQVEKIKVR